MAEEPKGGEEKPARQSLAAKLKALSEKATATIGEVKAGGGAPASAPAAAPAAAAAGTKPAAPAAPAPKAAPAAAPARPAEPGAPKPSAAAAAPRLAATPALKPAAPAAAPAAPAAKPAPAPAAPRPAAPAPPAAAKPAAPAPAAAAKPADEGPKASEKMSARLAKDGIAKMAPEGAPAAASPASPVAPPPAAAPTTGGSALATDRIAQRLRGEAPSGASPAPAAPPPPPPPPEAPEKPRLQSPYVDDSIFAKLPPSFQKIIRGAATDAGAIPVKAALKRLQGPELERQLELLEGFVDNIEAVLRRRFLPEELEKYIFLEPKGDLSLRYGDGEIKIRAKCWEFFLLSRTRRPLGKDGMAALKARFAECFKFELENTPVCAMKVMTPVEFDEGDDAYYLEGSLELGGWCEMRFESAAAFSDGRLFIATLQPRVARGKDIPPGKGKNPRDFVAMLRKNRRR